MQETQAINAATPNKQATPIRAILIWGIFRSLSVYTGVATSGWSLDAELTRRDTS